MLCGRGPHGRKLVAELSIGEDAGSQSQACCSIYPRNLGESAQRVCAHIGPTRRLPPRRRDSPLRSANGASALCTGGTVGSSRTASAEHQPRPQPATARTRDGRPQDRPRQGLLELGGRGVRGRGPLGFGQHAYRDAGAGDRRRGGQGSGHAHRHVRPRPLGCFPFVAGQRCRSSTPPDHQAAVNCPVAPTDRIVASRGVQPGCCAGGWLVSCRAGLTSRGVSR